MRPRRLAVAIALHRDVIVVVQRHHARGLGRTGHHHPDVLAHLLEVVDELGIAGVEAEPSSGQVRPLR